jgi:putative inorganic carbon (HCO3(-)) transporter
MASRSSLLTRPTPVARGTVLSVGLSVGALVAAVVLSSVLAYDTKVGVELLVVLCFAPVALLRLPLAICVWTALLFFSRTSALDAGLDKILLFFVICWIGLLVGRRAKLREAMAGNQTVIVLVIGFVIWMLLSLAWAPAPGAANRAVKELLYAGIGFMLVLGVIVERRHVRWLAIAFVTGAALTVLWGAAKGGISVGGSGGAGGGETVAAEGRFQGGAGDPNYLAAVLVPAIMLAGGLAVRRVPGQRLLLAFAVAVIAIGLAATQSRGGLIGAGVCAIVALVIWRGRRMLILGLMALATGAIATFFLANPAAWSRIQESNQGSGRIDIWSVAWRIVQDHPLVGVGIAQFPQVSPHYVLQPGALNYVSLIVEKHIVVHNLYLQLWVEDGIIGLLLFLGVVVASLAAGWRAAKWFDAQGDTEMLALARASILALIGMLTASFFLSNLEAGQLWVLLAFGPILAGLARRQMRAPPPYLRFSG